MNSQEKTFDAIAKLKDIELELLRLRNALDMTNKIIDAQTRPWVGLTDGDEIDWDGGDLKSLIAAVEAKLKEKNT